MVTRRQKYAKMSKNCADLPPVLAVIDFGFLPRWLSDLVAVSAFDVESACRMRQVQYPLGEGQRNHVQATGECSVFRATYVQYRGM